MWRHHVYTILCSWFLVVTNINQLLHSQLLATNVQICMGDVGANDDPLINS